MPWFVQQRKKWLARAPAYQECALPLVAIFLIGCETTSSTVVDAPSRQPRW
jgi:hypothetical protein